MVNKERNEPLASDGEEPIFLDFSYFPEVEGVFFEHTKKKYRSRLSALGLQLVESEFDF